MRSRPISVLTAAAATITFALACAPHAAAATIKSDTCVDSGGRTWTSRVVWGAEYTDSAGVKRVRVDWAGWTTNAARMVTESSVRTYGAAGNQLQEQQWTGWYNYLGGTSWRNRDPADPPSAPGQSKVKITVGEDGDGSGDCTTTFVQPGSPTKPVNATAAAPTAAGWVSGQSSVPLGGAGCFSDNRSTATAVALAKEWDYWDNCGGTEVSASAVGLPAAPGGGDHVFRWSKPAGDSNVYQKLNRTFTKDNWATGSAGPGVPNTGSPADASGVYKVTQYIPSSRFRVARGWVILSEFKENYTDSSGAWRQDSTWGLGCNTFSGNGLTCSLMPHTTPRFSLNSYMDRWVTWEYRIYQGAKDTTGHGGRIELWADGKLLDTGYDAQEPVGSAAFAPAAKTRSWVWIVGQYTSNQTTGGVPDYKNIDVTSYIGRSSVTPIR